MGSDLEGLLARRIGNVAPSFIREILKVAAEPGIISFAGGLPDPRHFPIEGLRHAAMVVLADEGAKALQYGASEGDAELRAWIASHYRQQGIEVGSEQILITNGSQQALDLLGKVLCDEGDGVMVESPGYLGALQSFSLYGPRFLPLAMEEDGPSLGDLERWLAAARPKLLYTTPNFQNPTGISYSEAKRRAVAEQVEGAPLLLIEDDPYGDLRFRGSRAVSFKSLLPEQTLLLGSFSKTIAPALRLGWVVAPPWLMRRLVIAKQAADLHSNGLAQRILLHYLRGSSYDDHVRGIAGHYGAQMEAMRGAIARHLPPQIEVTHPEGGMFLWARLPQGMSSRALFDRCIARGVAFVPGHPFYIGCDDSNTLRLNFTNSDAAAIDRGIAVIGAALQEETA